MIIRPTPYSFYTFSRMAEVKEIIVVCDPSYRDVFEGFIPRNMHLLLWHVLCIGCIAVGHIILIWFCSCSQTPSIRSRLNLNSPYLGRKDKILFTVDSRCMHICILFSTTLRMKMSPWSWRKSLRFVFLGRSLNCCLVLNPPTLYISLKSYLCFISKSVALAFTIFENWEGCLVLFLGYAPMKKSWFNVMKIVASLLLFRRHIMLYCRRNVHFDP